MQNKWPIHEIIFITPTSSQPRYHKRAAQIVKLCDITVFSFHRQYYNENTFPEQIPCYSLGKTSDMKYFRRIIQIIPAIFKIRNHLRKKRNCIFYALSLDCMVIARLCGLNRGFYEIGDLRQDTGFGKLFGFLESKLLRNIYGVIFTSRYFYGDFYKNKSILPEERVYIIDNKVSRKLINQRPSEKQFPPKRIVIGIVGFLRFRIPIELLLQFVRVRSEFYLIECFGDGPLRDLIESYTCENIRYHGSFKNPDELPKIYSQIDINYVVYDNSDRNVQLAIPNKLFESAYFGVPIVCCENSSVGKMAVDWQIGKMVRIDNKDNFEEDLGSIDKKWLQLNSENCFKISSNELIDDGDRILRNIFKNIVNLR